MDCHLGIYCYDSRKRELKRDCKFFKKDGKLVSCIISWKKRKMRRCETCKLQSNF